MATIIKASEKEQLSWPNWARVLALGGIVLNHLVESFSAGSIFTHPSSDWPAFTERLSQVWPQTYDSFALSLIQFLGWLGDNCVGVFILVSGFGLAYSGYRGAKEYFSRRLLRIYPAYILAHFVILLLAIPFGELTLGFDNYRTILSLLGLRFYDGLFFYINPSWWFVWLILQLYLVFPIVWKALLRFGSTRTFLVALLITIASRAYAATSGDSTYFLYMGMFGGTRLVEFVAGILLGHAIAEGRISSRELTTPKYGAAFLGVYVFGFAVSLTWIGSTVSNLLISIGMTGVFAYASHIFSNAVLVNRFVTWFSARSYSYYLIHQPPLAWLRYSDTSTTAHLLVAFGWYALCVPLAYAMDLFVTRSRKLIESCRNHVKNEKIHES